MSRRHGTRTAVALAVACALAAGCGGGETIDGEPPAEASGDAADAPPALQTRTAEPEDAAPRAAPPIGPLTSRGEPAAPGPTAPPLAAPDAATGRLVWDLPEGWTAAPPASPMRMAQATIPGPGGPAELVVFHFGPGGGGGVDANIERWIGQVDAGAEPERGSFVSDGLRVTWVDVAGTLQPSGMGMGPAEPQPGSRLLGAVVEGPGGPWFFKATGPAATLAAARQRFLDMLGAARIE